MKYSILAFFIMFSIHTSKAQSIKVSELKTCIDKPLRVLLLEEDDYYLKKIKKKGGASALKRYRESIEANNELFKQYVKSLWKLNDNIEFMSTSEGLAKAAKDKSKEYAYLKFIEYVSDYDKGKVRARSMKYGIGGKKNVKGIIDFFPIINSEETEDYHMIFMMHYFQNRLEAIIEDKSNRVLKKYVKRELKENCSLLEGKKLVLQSEDIKKGLTASKIESKYGSPVKILRRKDYNTTIVTDNNIAFGVILLAGEATANAGGTVSVTRSKFMRVIMDKETGKILGVSASGVNGLTGFKGKFSEKDFEVFKKCD